MSWGKANTQLNTVSLKKEARQGERLSGLFRGQVAGKSQGATFSGKAATYSLAGVRRRKGLREVAGAVAGGNPKKRVGENYL